MQLKTKFILAILGISILIPVIPLALLTNTPIPDSRSLELTIENSVIFDFDDLVTREPIRVENNSQILGMNFPGSLQVN